MLDYIWKQQTQALWMLCRHSTSTQREYWAGLLRQRPQSRAGSPEKCAQSLLPSQIWMVSCADREGARFWHSYPQLLASLFGEIPCSHAELWFQPRRSTWQCSRSDLLPAECSWVKLYSRSQQSKPSSPWQGIATRPEKHQPSLQQDNLNKHYNSLSGSSLLQWFGPSL